MRSYLQLRNEVVLLEDAGHEGEDIRGQQQGGVGPELRRVGGRGREELRGGTGDAEQRVDVERPDDAFLVDLLQEHLDLATQERLAGA